MATPLSSARGSAPHEDSNESSNDAAALAINHYTLALFDIVRVALNVSAIAISGWLAFIIYYGPESFMPMANLLLLFEPSFIQYGKLAMLGGIIYSAINFMKYGREVSGPLDQRLQRLISTWCLSLLTVISVLFLFKTGSDFSRGWMMVWAVITPALLIGAMTIERCVVAGLLHVGFSRRRVAIVGATEQASRLVERLSDEHASESFDLVGVFDDELPEDGAGACAPLLRGTLFELTQLCRHDPVDVVIIAFPGSESHRIADTVDRLMELPVDIFLGPDLAHFELTHRAATQLGPIPVTSLTRLPTRDWAGIAKWLEDKVIVLAAAFFLAPLLLLTALAIKIDSRGPVLFKQRRFGFNNVAFEVYKFRTMHVDQGDLSGARQTERNDSRVTRVGRFLRKTSIDELPQLINVWLGHMSIVGPRAHPVGMLVNNQPYDAVVHHYAARHRVKPGITGLAQVNGNRGEVNTQEKARKRVDYDIFYIENWSIWLDLSIMLRTVIKLPFDRSAY